MKRQLTVSYLCDNKSKKRPYLRLLGFWLESSFEIGETVEIIQEQKQIIIRKTGVRNEY
jgi:hypothetical protein